MEKYIYCEENGLWYELHGEYYFPMLVIPTQQTIGIYGRRHLRYLKEVQTVLYTSLLADGKLNDYLADVDKRAAEMLSHLVEQIAEEEGVTESLKADNQMLWVQRMNNIRNRAEEIINADLIYT